MKKRRKERRKIKLIKPRFQLKLIGVFVGISALGFVLQSLHVAFRLSDLAASMPEGGASLMAVMPELPIEILIFSFGMVLPLTVAIGIFVTHRIAGPVYRFEQYLSSLARGEYLGPCRIRRGDELQDLCAIINQAVESLREEQEGASEETESPEPLRKAG
jgi:hypothetical protein